MALYFIEYDKNFKNFNEENIKIIDILNENTESGEWKTLDFASFGASGLELFVYGYKMSFLITILVTSKKD
ncbi:hypothetical protein GCM10008934_38390 [Virgibacillus salarius]|uniref:hypothetical protein n=1 Tax=Sporosarcina aquimarina TaxID=114975 RepID=UPI001C8F0F0D|nr:hypothetical protein [Sporosarcina aquimarina]MBY0221902.1 hypothetical protein [Sporosarcina aquimarina]